MKAFVFKISSENVERRKYLSIEQVLKEKDASKTLSPPPKWKSRTITQETACLIRLLSTGRKNKNSVWIWSSAGILTLLSRSWRPYQWQVERRMELDRGSFLYYHFLRAVREWIKVLYFVPCTVVSVHSEVLFFIVMQTHNNPKGRVVIAQWKEKPRERKVGKEERSSGYGSKWPGIGM